MIDVFTQSFSQELAAILYFFHNVKQEEFHWNQQELPTQTNVESKLSGHANLTLLC